MLSAVYATAIPSVCLSVRPSVTRVDQSKTVEAKIMQFSPYSSPIGGAEIASTGKCKYGKQKYKVAKCVRVENTSTENSSTATQGWKPQVRKIKVRVSRVGKCKYGKIEYGVTVQLLEIRLK